MASPKDRDRLEVVVLEAQGLLAVAGKILAFRRRDIEVKRSALKVSIKCRVVDGTKIRMGAAVNVWSHI